MVTDAPTQPVPEDPPPIVTNDIQEFGQWLLGLRMTGMVPPDACGLVPGGLSIQGEC